MKPTFSTAFAILVCALTAACASDVDRYPSLAIRDAERVQGQFTPSSPAQVEAVQPVATPDEIAEIVEQADEVHNRFLAKRSETRRLIETARGLSIDSNERQRALIALADLTSLRSDMSVSLSDLDLLRAEAETSFAPIDDILQAQARISLSLSVQNGILNSLWNQLGP